jgi:cell envelope opacity-associated protein A
MEKRNSASARIAAAAALVVAVLVVIVVVAAATDGGSPSGRHRHRQQSQRETAPRRTEAKTYTVKTGDTLTAIAHKTGVPVAELLALNPEVDPQILIAGQTLKLR